MRIRLFLLLLLVNICTCHERAEANGVNEFCATTLAQTANEEIVPSNDTLVLSYEDRKITTRRRIVRWGVRTAAIASTTALAFSLYNPFGGQSSSAVNSKHVGRLGKILLRDAEFVHDSGDPLFYYERVLAAASRGEDFMNDCSYWSVPGGRPFAFNLVENRIDANRIRVISPNLPSSTTAVGKAIMERIESSPLEVKVFSFQTKSGVHEAALPFFQHQVLGPANPNDSSLNSSSDFDLSAVTALRFIDMPGPTVLDVFKRAYSQSQSDPHLQNLMDKTLVNDFPLFTGWIFSDAQMNRRSDEPWLLHLSWATVQRDPRLNENAFLVMRSQPCKENVQVLQGLLAKGLDQETRLQILETLLAQDDSAADAIIVDEVLSGKTFGISVKTLWASDDRTSRQWRLSERLVKTALDRHIISHPDLWELEPKLKL